MSALTFNDPTNTEVGIYNANSLQLASQSAVGPTPASGMKIYSINNKFTWLDASDGYTRTLDGTLTANRTYTLPNTTGTVVLATYAPDPFVVGYGSGSGSLPSGSTLLGYQISYSGSGICTAMGWQAGSTLSSGVNNTLFGYTAGNVLQSGSYNVIVGDNAFSQSALSDTGNTAIGYAALENQGGASTPNTAIGYNAGGYVTTGGSNVLVGDGAGYASGATNQLTTGGSNTIIGSESSVYTSSASNTLIGQNILPTASTTYSSSIALGVGITVNASNTMFLGSAITSILPPSNNTCSLGSASLQFSNLECVNATFTGTVTGIGGGTYISTFSQLTSGAFSSTVPTGAIIAYIDAVGGGGAGGAQSSGGGGGGGGGAIMGLSVSVVAGWTISGSVGAGGTGVSSTNPGNPGGATTISVNGGANITLNGGGGGLGSGSTGGAGGSVVLSATTAGGAGGAASGGTGINGVYASANVMSGAGGGGGTGFGTGGNTINYAGNTGVSTTGGGGASAFASAAHGTAGSLGSGGAGGISTSGAGGTGLIYIRYYSN